MFRMRFVSAWAALAVVIASIVLPYDLLADGDFVYRPELHISGPLAETVKWEAALETKIKSDARKASEIWLVAGVNWEATSYLTIIPEFIYITKGGNAALSEHRPRLSFEVGDEIGVLELDLRCGFEYRMKEDRDEYWRYRFRVNLEFPRIGSVTPFAYDEIFYEFGDKDELDRNEAGVGTGIPLGDNLGLTVDLRCCHVKSEGDWAADIHLLTTFEYSF